MNNARRKQLQEIQDELRGIYERLDILYEEEQEAFDNMPESLQGSERGDHTQDAIDAIEGVRDQVLEAADGIDEIIE